MTSRERVIRSIRFEGPDRVPVLHRIKPGFFRLHEKEIEELRTKYPSDILQSEKTHTWFTFSTAGKLNMDLMNQWRRSVGLPLQAEPGSKRKNWGMAYPLAAVVPNLLAAVQGKGVQKGGPFASYASAGPAVKKDYAAVEFDSFKKGAEGVKALGGKAVSFKAQLGPAGTDWFLKGAPRSNYDCYKLEKPGEASGATRNYVFGYFLKGSGAHKTWVRYYQRRDRYNTRGGVTIQGAAWYIGTETYNYPVGVIVDEVKR